MRKPFLILASAALLFSARAETLNGLCTTVFDGTSTLHDFTGTATSRVFQATWTPSDASHPATMDAVIVFEVAGLDTQHAKRDKKMRAQFDTKNHPTLTGTFTGAPIPRAGQTLAQAPTFVLNVDGKDQTIPFRVRDLREEADRISFVGEFDLSLKATGVRPPSVVGVIRVGDTLKVQSTVTLTRKAAGN